MNRASRNLNAYLNCLIVGRTLSAGIITNVTLSDLRVNSSREVGYLSKELICISPSGISCVIRLLPAAHVQQQLYPCTVTVAAYP